MYWVVSFGVWFGLGLGTLWLCERYGEGEDDLTVGIVLLMLLVGAPFFFLLLGSLLCQVKISRRKRLPEAPPKPLHVVEAEREVENWFSPMARQ